MRCARPNRYLGIVLAVIATTTAAAQGARPSPARVTGRVADAVGAAIVKAEVAVTNTAVRVETGPDGRFELRDVPSGSAEIVVRRLGFAPATFTLDLDPGETRDIRVLLSPVAMIIDSVAIIAQPEEIEKAYGGFEQRRSRGFGTFITRDEIEKKRPRVTTDMLRNVHGVRLIRENGTPVLISERLGSTAICPLRYFVDGADYPLFGQSIDAMVQISDVGAIEIYPGGATVPPQFAGRESTCGVVAIWTRQGQRRKQ